MATESVMAFALFNVTTAQMRTTHGREMTELDVPWAERSGETDTAMNVPEKTFADDLQFAMSAVIGPIVCLFGMAGNLVSIITWQRPGMGSSTGRYLTGQAVANFCLLLMFLLCDSLQYWCPEVKYSVVYGVFFSYLGFPVFYLSIICSIWFTVGLTVDRYLMVCWITKAKKFCSESRANVGLALISFNSFLVNTPHFASYTPVYQDDGSGGGGGDNNTSIKEPKVAFTETAFGVGEGGKFYEFWVHCIVLILVPWVSVLFMNVMIIVKINQANKRMADKKTRESLKKSKESENQVTRLLLSVTFTFLFFIGLQCVVQCLRMRKPAGANLEMVSASYSFGKTGILFNSSLNVVLYCLTGRRFRLELLKMLGLAKKDLLLSSVVDTSSSNISTTSMSTKSVSKTVTKDA